MTAADLPGSPPRGPMENAVCQGHHPHRHSSICSEDHHEFDPHWKPPRVAPVDAAECVGAIDFGPGRGHRLCGRRQSVQGLRPQHGRRRRDQYADAAARDALVGFPTIIKMTVLMVDRRVTPRARRLAAWNRPLMASRNPWVRRVRPSDALQVAAHEGCPVFHRLDLGEWAASYAPGSIGFTTSRRATTSISTRAPLASPVTPTQVRAGRRPAAK